MKLPPRKITEINNSNTVKEFEDAANIQLADRIRRKIKPDVQAVININPKDYRIINIVKERTVNNSTVESEIYTPQKDFYLMGINTTILARGSGDYTMTIRGTINNQSVILKVMKIHDTSTFTDNISFPIPIKLDKDKAISVQHDRNVSTSSSSVLIYGYEVDVV